MIKKRNILSFEDARCFVRELGINSSKQWSKYCKSEDKPYNIPATPQMVYKDKGWVSWGDWLGTGVVATQKLKYLPFEEAREFARSLRLVSGGDWRRYCKSGDKPDDIPSGSSSVYKNKGWISWGDWLGTGVVATQKLKYLPFEEAREFARSLGLKGQKEWVEYCKSGDKPDNIPTTASAIYKYLGWLSTADWLGTRLGFKRGQYSTYSEAKIFSKKIEVKTQKEWYDWCKKNDVPYSIPVSPDRIYKNKGWVSWGDFFDTGYVHKKEFISFEEARKFVRGLKLKGHKEWQEYSASGKKPDNIPSVPGTSYKGKGWISIGDWLGTGSVATQKLKYLPFEEAREFVHNINLVNQKEWYSWWAENKPNNIPQKPHRTYKNKGWVGYGDWIGTGRISDRNREYLPFEEAREFAISLGLKSGKEWIEWWRKNKPKDIPAVPHKTYKNKGWISMPDWLGKEKQLPFEEAREFVRGLGLKNNKEWNEWWRKNRPNNIPSTPKATYKNKGWLSLSDWIGTRPGFKEGQYLSFEEARNFVRGLKFESLKEWEKWWRENKPYNIPATPNQIYKDKGWMGVADWIGVDGIKRIKYRPFKEVKEFVRELRFTSRIEWLEYCKSGKKPHDIPANPNSIYRKR